MKNKKQELGLETLGSEREKRKGIRSSMTS